MLPPWTGHGHGRCDLRVPASCDTHEQEAVHDATASAMSQQQQVKIWHLVTCKGWGVEVHDLSGVGWGCWDEGGTG